jgi:hypothetical protein
MRHGFENLWSSVSCSLPVLTIGSVARGRSSRDSTYLQIQSYLYWPRLQTGSLLWKGFQSLNQSLFSRAVMSEFELDSGKTMGTASCQKTRRQGLMKVRRCHSPEAVGLGFVLPNPPVFWLLPWPNPENPPNVDMLKEGIVK